MPKPFGFIKNALSASGKVLLLLLVLFLLAVCLLLLLLFIDWRIIVAALPLFIAVIFLFAAWIAPVCKIQKKILLAGECIALATLTLVLAPVGVNIYENVVSVSDRGVYSYLQSLPFDEDSELARLEEPASVQFDKTNRPRLLTSSSFYPLTASFVNATYPEADFARSFGESDYLSVNRSYGFLTDGVSDVVIDRENARGIDSSKTKSTTIGKDALVIFTHKSNKVTNLTKEQLTKICTGEITNWKEVGGADLTIKLYTQHNLTCSQDLLEKFIKQQVTAGETKWEFILPYFTFAKHSIEYRNVKGALGFTFLSDIDERYKNTHTISIDGIFADETTVATGTYPAAEDICAVTRKETTENTELLIRWILSEEGQLLVRKNRFVPVLLP